MKIPVIKLEDIILYTDGSCGSLGVCGWSIFSEFDGKVLELSGFEAGTSQRAELLAICKAIEFAPADRAVIIATDSGYGISCFEDFRKSWLKSGFKTAKKTDVKHQDILIPAYAMIDTKMVSFRKVKGHSGLRGNEKADQLAKKARYSGEKLI